MVNSIGLFGCGAIGKALLHASASRQLAVRIAGVASRTEKARLRLCHCSIRRRLIFYRMN